MSENLLKYIKETKNHPLQNVFQISDDNTTITSLYDKKEKIIYGNGKVYLETLGREILTYMDKRLFNFVDTYNIEENTGNNNFIDLIQIENDYINTIIEFKSNASLGKDKKRYVQQAFKQIESYVDEKVKERIKTKSVFVGVCIIDVEKIIKTPLLIDAYYNSIKQNIKYKIDKSLELYGIYIESLIYNVNNKSYDEESKSYLLPVCEKYKIIEESPLEKMKGSKASFERNAIDAKNTITSTPSLGISNVRIRLNTFENISKRNLVIDIYKTIVKGFNNNNFNCLNQSSNSKTFIYSKNQSIVEIRDNYATIISTNAATIDGQQSTEIPYIINDALLYNGNNKNKNSLKSELLSLLKNKDGLQRSSQNDIQSFLSFLNKLYFNYILGEVENTEEAIEIAYGKNNTIATDKEDNFFIKESSKMRYISNEVHEKKGLLLEYPNSHGYFTTNKIWLSIPISLFNFINNADKRNKKSFIMLYIEAKKCKFKFDNKLNQVLQSIINETESDNNNIKEKIFNEKNDIKNIKKDIKNKEIYIKELEMDIIEFLKDNNKTFAQKFINRKENSLEEIKSLENQLISKKNQIEKIYKQNITEYEMKDNKYINDIYDISMLWKYIILEWNKQNNIIAKDSEIIWGHVVLGFVLKRLNINNIIEFRKNIKNNKIHNDIIKVIRIILSIIEDFNLNITSINNKKEEDLKKEMLINKNTKKEYSYFEVFENYLLV